MKPEFKMFLNANFARLFIEQEKTEVAKEMREHFRLSKRYVNKLVKEYLTIFTRCISSTKQTENEMYMNCISQPKAAFMNDDNNLVLVYDSRANY